MKAAGHDIGVCSWSLRPTSMTELVDLAGQIGLSHIQLALGPLLTMPENLRRAELNIVRGSGLTLTAGMISFPGEDYSSIPRIRTTGGLVPDDAWEARKKLCAQAGALCAELGMKLLTFHIGFVPPSSHDDYEKMIARVAEVATDLANRGIDLGMESGQETAPELLQFLNDLPVRNVAINFDPANMILYGAGDPIAAIRTLNRHIRHVHAKDAIASKTPGIDWGREVPVGTGQVDIEQFLLALNDVAYTGPIVIECEAGQQRVADVKTAVANLVAGAR